MAPQDNTTPTTTTPSVEAPRCASAPSDGAELPMLQRTVVLLQQGVEEGANGIPKQDAKVQWAAQAIEDDDDDEYNSDDSEDSIPLSRSDFMLERGKGNNVKVGNVITKDGSSVDRPPK